MSDITSSDAAVLGEIGPQAGFERFSDAELGEIQRGFAVRLSDAFDGANDSDIARRLYTGHTTVRPYTRGQRLPIAEMLIMISRVTGVSIDWLLTGREPKFLLDRTSLFGPEEEQRIKELAKRSGRSFEDQVRALTIAALELAGKV